MSNRHIPCVRHSIESSHSIAIDVSFKTPLTGIPRCAVNVELTIDMQESHTILIMQKGEGPGVTVMLLIIDHGVLPCRIDIDLLGWGQQALQPSRGRRHCL